MTVAVQFAATATSDALPKIARAFDAVKPLLAPVCERSELLINHQQRQVQFLVYFPNFEDSQAFLKKNAGPMLQPFLGMLQNVSGPFFLALEGEIGSR